MITRFQGDAGRENLRNAILEQQCVAHNPGIADALRDVLELVQFKTGEVLTQQNGTDRDIYLILAGKVSIQVNGREVAIRGADQHVGEMALIDTKARRSATIEAIEDTVAAKISESHFSGIAQSYPDLWRRLALELGNRLRERSKYVREVNPRPVLFVGSSTEGLKVAKQIQVGLSHSGCLVTVWTDNVFVPGHYTMEDLENKVQSADFGVLVCTSDDHVTNVDRGTDRHAPRDNVILEIGMSLGALGRARTFLVHPRGANLKIPTDLLGITPVDYVADDPANLASHLAPVCTQISDVIASLGPR